MRFKVLSKFCFGMILKTAIKKLNKITYKQDTYFLRNYF